MLFFCSWCLSACYAILFSLIFVEKWAGGTLGKPQPVLVDASGGEKGRVHEGWLAHKYALNVDVYFLPFSYLIQGEAKQPGDQGSVHSFIANYLLTLGALEVTR